MSNDEIRGCNFVQHGRFPGGWETHWTHDGQGNVRNFTDPEYGNYLMMNERAIVHQTFYTAVFTERQMEGATYKIAFQYENLGEGGNSKVIVRTAGGKDLPIDLSVKNPDQPLADWNHYSPNAFEIVVAADENITLELHGSDLSGSSGLRMTDVDVQLHLIPLQLKHIQLDDRVYQTQTLVNV